MVEKMRTLRQARAVALGAGLVLTVALPGCGAAAKAAATSKRLAVVASVWPVAQLAQYIGGPYVKVTDLAAGAVPPQGLSLSAAARSALAGAGLVVDVGDGYQPQVERAAASARRHLSLLPAVSKTALPYEFWLDPTLMSAAAVAVGKAMEAADPSQKAHFADGVRDFQSVAQSVSSDYVNSLSTCNRHQIMTADGAFGRLASRFGLQDLSVQALGQEEAVAMVAKDRLPSVFTEEGVSSGPLQVVASKAAVSVKTLNPMEETPLSGTARANSYFSVMEDNLQALEGALACDNSEVFS
jgi:zinc transport system substrate-binding protein